MTALRFADVAEGVRATIAAYTHALDDGRTDDVVATFFADGSCDIPGLGAFAGHDALREGYGRFQPKRRVRHLVVNTEITAWNDDEAHATSDVVVLVQGDAGWAIQVVGRYTDTLHRDHDHDDARGWRFHHRGATFAPAR